MAIDDLIAQAVDRANTFSDRATSALDALKRARHTDLTTHIQLPSAEAPSPFVDPSADPVAFPDWQDPLGQFPTTPDLGNLYAIRDVDIPAAPGVNLTGLFDTPRPSTDLPVWDGQAPDLHADDIYNEMKSIAMPLLTDVQLPTITPLTLGTPPGLVLPTYDAIAVPDAIPAPKDYAAYCEAKYEKLAPVVRNFVDDIMQRWMQRYAPEYEEQRAALHAKLLAGMNNTVLPDDIESAMYSRAQFRTEQEYVKAEEGVLETQKARGFIVPPSAVTSAMSQARLAGALALADQSAQIYIERKKLEVQHLQFVLGLASQQITSVRDLAVKYAETGLGIVGQAFAMADKITANAITMFEHERSRHQFQLELMAALNAQYEVKLKAALSGLEGYKLQLQAYELQANVEKLQLDAVKTQIEAQELLVHRYTAVIDAIVKRAEVDKIKVEQFRVLAESFKVGLDARVATFEVYKAALEGDKAKVQGELAKVEMYNAEVHAAESKIHSETLKLDASVKSQDAKYKVYNTKVDQYKTSVNVALEKFRAKAEVKKLSQELYMNSLKTNLTKFEVGFEKFKMDTQKNIEQFKGDLAIRMAEIDFAVRQDDFELKKMGHIADGFTNMASAALQSLNSTIASTTSM